MLQVVQLHFGKNIPGAMADGSRVTTAAWSCKGLGSSRVAALIPYRLVPVRFLGLSQQKAPSWRSTSPWCPWRAGERGCCR